MPTNTFVKVFALVFAALVIIPSSADAQLFKRFRKTEKNKEDNSHPKPEFKSISEVTESSEVSDGLFTIYRDTLTGKSWMVLSESALEGEFIIFPKLRTEFYRRVISEVVTVEA